jgi:hypothetical protein
MCYISKKIVTFKKLTKTKHWHMYLYVCVKDDGMLLGFVWQEIADTCWTLQMCCIMLVKQVEVEGVARIE